MKSKYIKLLMSIALDIIGILPFLFPFLGEFIDIVWAPLSAYLITKMYKNKISKYTAVIGFVEEALPYTDVVPTFTITWLLTYLFSKEN